MFIDRNLKLKLNSLHFDDWEPDPNFRIQNTDVERDSFVPKKSERNDANRMIGEYKFNPESVQNSRNTSYLRNNAAISQAGREISKRVIFPQLYIEADAVNQLTEILKLASSYAEEITLNLTWRSILLDLGDFVSLNVNISGTQFSNAPCMVREIGYNPEGFKLECRLWSFALTPFEGYTPTNSGITGGVNAAITVET